MAQANSAWDKKPEPDIKVIEKIARRCLHIEGEDPCVAKLDHTTGYGLKLYAIKKNGRNASMNVWPGALPKAPQSRAATTHWLQANTTVPVMPACCSEGAGDNEFGLSWMVEQYESPRSFGPHVFVQMSWGSKKKLVEALATYHAQFLNPKNRFKTVGSIFFGVDPELETDSSNTDVAGKKAEKRFYIQDLDSDLPHPSISKFTDLLYSELDETIEGMSRDLSEAEDCECGECRTPESDIAVAERVRTTVAEIFPPEVDFFTETVIELPPLQEKLLAVNRKGEIGEIKQASSASTVPIWRAYQLPYMLLGPERLEVPAEGAPGYRAGYVEWWKAKLRDVYLEKIETLHPGFQQRLKQYQTLNDLAWLILKCGFEDPVVVEEVENWLMRWRKATITA